MTYSKLLASNWKCGKQENDAIGAMKLNLIQENKQFMNMTAHEPKTESKDSLPELELKSTLWLTKTIDWHVIGLNYWHVIDLIDWLTCDWLEWFIDWHMIGLM